MLDYKGGKISINNNQLLRESILFERSTLDKVKFTETDEVTYVVVIKEGDVEIEKLEI